MPNKTKTHAQRLRPNMVKNKRPSAHRMGYNRHWRKIRALYLASNPLCQGRCKKLGRTVMATEVDHITSKAKGGTDEDDNLCGYCKSCHSRKTVLVDGGLGFKKQ